MAIARLPRRPIRTPYAQRSERDPWVLAMPAALANRECCAGAGDAGPGVWACGATTAMDPDADRICWNYLATDGVAAEVRDVVGYPVSRPVTRTVIFLPAYALVSFRVAEVAPLTAPPFAYHW